MKSTGILTITLIPALAFVCACKKGEASNAAPQPAVEAVVEAQPQTKGTKPAAAATTEKAPAKKMQEALKPYVRKETYFQLPNYKGGDIDLANYNGKPVMLMFFTEGCPFCRKAAPFVQQMNLAYKAKGLGVIGIALEDDPAAPENFASDFGLTFPIAYKGHLAARQYRTQGVPYIFLLTKDHEVQNVWPGYDESFNGSIEQGINEVIK